MKANEKSKVTLTLAQLKKLVAESHDDPQTDWCVVRLGGSVGDKSDHYVGRSKCAIVKDGLTHEEALALAKDYRRMTSPGDRKYYGITYKAVQSSMVTEGFDTEDGWDCDEIRDSGLLDTLRKCVNLQYTLDKCTRASANFGDTLGDLKAYVNELAEEMMNAVAGFPEGDDEEFQGQDAMGDDEEIEVME